MRADSLSKFEDLSFCDNLALYYICNETPPKTLALAFLAGDPKVAGSILGLLDSKRREYVHALMASQKDSPESDKSDALSGMLIIAENLMLRGLIEKKGMYYYGVQK